MFHPDQLASLPLLPYPRQLVISTLDVCNSSSFSNSPSSLILGNATSRDASDFEPQQSRFSHSRSASGCDLSFQTQAHFYYALARTLKNGNQAKQPRRSKALRLPPLPLEVVYQILREAQYTHPYPSASCKWKAEPDAFLNDTGILFRPYGVVGATSAEPERKLLFASPQLDKEALSKMASVRVVTNSKDQGWHT